MYVAIHRGRITVATSHLQPGGRRSTTNSSSSNNSGSSNAFTPACASTWSAEIDGLLYAPMTTTQAGPGTCTGVQTQGGRYAAFVCSPAHEDSQNADAEALGLLVAAYLSGGATIPHSKNGEHTIDPPRQFLRVAIVLEALLRVRDGDLMLGSSGSDKHVLVVAHLRQGRVASLQDLGLQFEATGAHGGSVLLRAPSMLKSDLDEIVLSCSYDATGTKNFCSRVLSTLAVRHRQSYGRQFWYYATTVIEQALNKICFAEKYWDSTATGFRQTHHSLSLVGLPTYQDGSIFSIIPSGYMLTAAQDLPQVAEQYPDQKDSGLSHPRIAYERFVQQEAEHVPLIDIDKKKWTSTSQLWSLRWATMPLEEKCLYDAQAGSDKGRANPGITD